MTWLTLKSNATIWHVNMEIVETVKVQHHQGDPTKVESIGFFFKNDEEPSLHFTDEEDEIGAVAKAVAEFMNRPKKT